MSLSNYFKSDLMGLHNIVQASMITYPKEVIIDSLRDFFSKDSYYHFSKDQWGFNNTTDHTNLTPGADIPPGHPGSTAVTSNLLSTRLFIGQNYRFDGIYYPAILIKNGGSKYVPISINREQGSIEYKDIVYEDGYGNTKIVKSPISFVTAGVWEGSIIIDVMTRSLTSRDDLVELIMMYFTEIAFDTIKDIGIVIKPPSAGSPSEREDRNDKLFMQSITLNIRTEWKRKIPVGNIIEAILFSVEFSGAGDNAPVAQNLTINSESALTDIIIGL